LLVRLIYISHAVDCHRRSSMLAGGWGNLLKPMAVDAPIKAGKKASQASPSSAVGPKRMLSKCEREDQKVKALEEKKLAKELKEKEKAEKDARPKGALSAYLIFCKENRERLKEANADISQPDLRTPPPLPRRDPHACHGRPRPRRGRHSESTNHRSCPAACAPLDVPRAQ
jgi:hypothetical protein